MRPAAAARKDMRDKEMARVDSANQQLYSTLTRLLARVAVGAVAHLRAQLDHSLLTLSRPQDKSQELMKRQDVSILQLRTIQHHKNISLYHPVANIHLSCLRSRSHFRQPLHPYHICRTEYNDPTGIPRLTCSI